MISMYQWGLGSYDGAEVCDLVGLLMLSKITQVVDKSGIGFYRDDGLGVMGRIGKPEIERRKNIFVFSKAMDLTLQ